MNQLLRLRFATLCCLALFGFALFFCVCAHVCIRVLIPAQIRDSFQWRYFSPAGRLDRVETFAGSSGYHPRGQSLFRKQSRASPICGRRCSSSKTRASKRGFRCYSIRDCADPSIRVIKRSAAGFSSGSSTAPWFSVSPSWRLNAVL